MKIRIGKSFDKETNEVFYQLQFKLDGERTYNAYSYDVFKEESDAKEALNKHLNGEREYTYFVSAEKVKRTIKGNRIDVKKVLIFYYICYSYSAFALFCASFAFAKAMIMSAVPSGPSTELLMHIS